MSAIFGRAGAGFAPALKGLAAMLTLLCCQAERAGAAVSLPEETVTSSVIYDADEDKYLSPGMVTVVRPEETKGENRNLPDLLEQVPGLRVIRMRGRNGYAVASVRGSTSSQVAVYVDGVLMNLQSESAVDLSAIPVDQVERIEVYRGYIPAQFGAQAMGGVINIVTKAPETRQTSLSLSAGSFGRYKAALSHSMPLGSGKFFGSLGYETYGGEFEYWNDNKTSYNKDDDYTGKRQGNGFTDQDILLKWEDAHWKARASWSRKDRDLALPAPGIDKPGEWTHPGTYLDTKRLDLSVGRKQAAGSVNWGWEVLYTAQDKLYDRGVSSVGGLGVYTSEYDARKLSLSLNASTAIGERHFLEFLGQYSGETLNVDGDMIYQYLDGISEYDSTEWDFSLQDTIALDKAGTFLLTPSVRWHKLDDESRFTWQIGISKEFSKNWMMKTTYGTYARSPNMYERFGDGAFILPPPNGSLLWETGKQFDVGVMWNDTLKSFGKPRVNVSLSGFMRETDDLIELFMESARYARYHNIARSEVKGVEAEASIDWEKWAFALSATWLDAVNKTEDSGSVRFNGKRLPNRPEWSGAARLTRKFRRGSVFAEYQYVGENFSDASEKALYDARHLVNIGFKYDLSPSTRLSVGVDDLFNNAWDLQMRPNGLYGPTSMLWHPIEGRSYYVTLDMEF